jgi:aspartate/glutamate racemase
MVSVLRRFEELTDEAAVLATNALWSMMSSIENLVQIPTRHIFSSVVMKA